MNIEEYQNQAYTTALPSARNWRYMGFGLASEAGEVAGKLKKLIRGDPGWSVTAIGAEIGDVLWYCAGLATELGLDLNKLAEENLKKLKNRQIDGKLQGDGDTR